MQPSAAQYRQHIANLLGKNPSERDQIFVETANQTAPEQAQPQPAAPANATVPEIIPGAAASNMTDNETYSAAVAGKQMAMCESIVDASMHNSCISQIAQRTKNISACAALVQMADQDLCNAYAQG